MAKHEEKMRMHSNPFESGSVLNSTQNKNWISCFKLFTLTLKYSFDFCFYYQKQMLNTKTVKQQHENGIYAIIGADLFCKP